MVIKYILLLWLLLLAVTKLLSASKTRSESESGSRSGQPEAALAHNVSIVTQETRSVSGNGREVNQDAEEKSEKSHTQSQDATSERPIGLSHASVSKMVTAFGKITMDVDPDIEMAAAEYLESTGRLYQPSY